MSIRSDIAELVKLGRFSEAATDDHLARVESFVLSVKLPITDEEARALVTILPVDGDDTCYGMTHSFVHFIELAPGWPLSDCLANESTGWIRHLRIRVENRDKFHPKKS